MTPAQIITIIVSVIVTSIIVTFTIVTNQPRVGEQLGGGGTNETDDAIGSGSTGREQQLFSFQDILKEVVTQN